MMLHIVLNVMRHSKSFIEKQSDTKILRWQWLRLKHIRGGPDCCVLFHILPNAKAFPSTSRSEFSIHDQHINFYLWPGFLFTHQYFFSLHEY